MAHLYSKQIVAVGSVSQESNRECRGKLAAALAYELEHAPFAKQVIEASLKTGTPVPAPFDNPPAPQFGEEIFQTAWRNLNNERDQAKDNNTVLRIRRQQVADWLEWYGWKDDVGFKNELYTYIVAMDNVYIPHEIKRLRNARKKAEREEKNKQKREARRAKSRKLG